MFITNNQVQTVGFTVPGCPPAALVCQVSTQFNGPIQRNYGMELTFQKAPPLGFGYYASGTLQRAFYDQLPASIYQSPSGSFLINGLQLNGQGSDIVPFAKGYAQGSFAWTNGGYASLGVDYEGNNNATYGPAYWVWNATIKQPISPLGIYVQLAVNNLFNYNQGTFIGQATLNNGLIRPGFKAPGGSTIIPIASSSSVQIVPQRYLRLEAGIPLGKF